MYVTSSQASEPVIRKCAAGHHFMSDTCDLCDSGVVKEYPYRVGDCIACSALCGEQAYGCTSPDPLVIGVGGL
jgi:hypothetical protein